MEALLNELHAEAAATRRLLERLPEDKLGWKPHPKSMTLGQLSRHVAALPAELCRLAQMDGFDASLANFEPASPSSAAEVMASFDDSIGEASRYLSGLGAEQASANWRLTLRGEEIFVVPRAGLLRSLLFNHWYHHRGQLTVYLRLLDVPLPAIYGRSADENPFA